MERQRVRNSPGWAAFDRRQRGIDEGNADPFPSTLGPPSSGPVRSFAPNNAGTAVKTVSSLFRPSQLAENKGKNQMYVDNAVKLNYGVQTTSEAVPAVKLLKDIHSWADDNLVEDVLAGVNNDFDQASALLKAMVSPSSEIGEASRTAELSSKNEKDNLPTVNSTMETRFTNGESVPMNMFSIPLEPEWEEDDVYLNHRKDAIKMMRAASQHSRAANNAFLRGDHHDAKQLSQRAQEEWSAADKLNNKAWKEILHLRNMNNDIWKLDLHGLHASEAVSALDEHLCKIESQVVTGVTGRSASTDESAKLEARPRNAMLQVITGRGKHSKGQASLPSAITSFLIENGYRFDEPRPGVFVVRPKFRR